MDNVREFFGLFLILAFTAMLPAFVNTCPSCPGASLPKKVLTTSVSVFSGTINTAHSQNVTTDEHDAVLHTYDVLATTTWVGLGKQSGQLSLPRLNSTARCAAATGQAEQTALFLVVGPQNQQPLFWTCLPPLRGRL
ncbi:MAG: hypothetical protein AB8G95_18865 [Anaerolineae bacterium]